MNNHETQLNRNVYCNPKPGGPGAAPAAPHAKMAQRDVGGPDRTWLPARAISQKRHRASL